MLKRKAVAGALLSIISCSSIAENSQLSYTNISFGYATSEIANEDFSGFGVSGSLAIDDAFNFIGSYTSFSSDDSFDAGLGSDDIDASELYLGFGYHTPVNRSVDFVTSLSFVKAELDYLVVEESGNGYAIGAGLRGKPTDKLEFGAAIGYVDIESEDDVSFSLSARVFTQQNASLGLGYVSSDDVDSVSFNLRFDL